MTNENQASAVLRGEGAAVVTIEGQERHIERDDATKAFARATAAIGNGL